MRRTKYDKRPKPKDGSVLMGKKTNPFIHYPAWTEAFFWSFLSNNIRRISGKYPPIREAKKLARRPYQGENKRMKWEYQCDECKEWFSDKETVVDHIIPVGKIRSYDDLPRYFELLFCGNDNLHVLCKACHQVKSNKENEERKK